MLHNHWGADVVRTGLYILNLEHKREIEKIKEIKQEVFHHKKLLGLRLVEMVTEGVLRAVLDHLKNLKEKNNYSQEDILREFEMLLLAWKKITIFVRNEDPIQNVVKQAKDLIDKKEETFFIFAKGNAIETAFSAIVQLQKEKYLLDKGYIWFANMDSETFPPSYYCGIHSSTFLL
ncbi:MAG: ribonuclease P subunit p25 family protein [Nanoarchaeota archaeon]